MKKDLQSIEPEIYEQHLLSAIDKSQIMWTMVSPLLCIRTGTEYHRNDFEFPLHYAIYRAMKNWKQLRSDQDLSIETPLSDNGIRTQLILLSKEPRPCIDEDNVDEAVEIYKKIRDEITEVDAITVVADSWKRWLKMRQLQNDANDIRRGIISDPDEFISQISASQQRISAAGTDSEFKEFSMDFIYGNTLNIERFTLGKEFSQLNSILGGFGRQEHVIFCAPTGGGKTVMACQIAADIASSKKQVLYISTEQPDRELYPRVISALTGIDFSVIKDGGDLRKVLNPVQLKAVEGVIERMQPYLHFVNWIGTGKNVKEDLESTVRRHIEQYGCVDLLVFDWYGSALGDSVDPATRRQMYMDAAWKIKQMAVAYNMACVSFAMAGAAANNKARITEEHLAECKMIHQNADAAFGISALRGSDDNSSGAQSSYSDKQYINCFKARKGRGLFFEVKREFKYQRFRKA